MIKAVIFDLDGVITNTDKLHYKAWKKLADRLEIPFDEKANESLKGISRMESLLLILGNRASDYTKDELEALASDKNAIYNSLIEAITPSWVLPGIIRFLEQLCNHHIKTAVFSSSRNASHIIELLGIRDLFDLVETGNEIEYSKPDCQGYLRICFLLRIPPAYCVMIDDSQSGIDGANYSGMKTIGIGTGLKNADVVLQSSDKLQFCLLEDIC